MSLQRVKFCAWSAILKWDSLMALAAVVHPAELHRTLSAMNHPDPIKARPPGITAVVRPPTNERMIPPASIPLSSPPPTAQQARAQPEHLGSPRVPIPPTGPTKALSHALMQASLRTMESRWEQEEEVPLYPPHAVEGMLSRMSVVEPGQPVPVLGDSLVATYVPSGHILDACSITGESSSKPLSLSGDRKRNSCFALSKNLLAH